MRILVLTLDSTHVLFFPPLALSAMDRKCVSCFFKFKSKGEEHLGDSDG